MLASWLSVNVRLVLIQGADGQMSVLYFVVALDTFEYV